MTLSTKIDLNTAIFDARAVMIDTHHEIGRISGLLHAVGLSKVAKQLDELVEPLHTQSQALVDAHIDEQQSQLAHNETMTGNLLLLALKSAT